MYQEETLASYWNQVLSTRISRRRAIVATGATAAGAAFLGDARRSRLLERLAQTPRGVLVKFTPQQHLY